MHACKHKPIKFTKKLFFTSKLTSNIYIGRSKKWLNN